MLPQVAGAGVSGHFSGWAWRGFCVAGAMTFELWGRAMDSGNSAERDARNRPNTPRSTVPRIGRTPARLRGKAGGRIEAPLAPSGARPGAPQRADALLRAADLTLASVAILALAPALALIALLIWASSPGPVFTRQLHAGRYGRPYGRLAFRTGSAVGHVLRRAGLDGLPQLFNVLAGEMSLVGPDPQPLALERRCPADPPRYETRAGVRPGLTGLAQVQGLSSEAMDAETARRRAALEATFVQQRSLGLYCIILMRAIGGVLSGRGSY